ncbi:DNA cytosine methyltransferase [Streptomyces sp. NPDC048332]|uniref:DNA cytosine methyltransferase n=1 Tax=Streptomyces sp. NPDC048332 TaxID=3154619 RepID=UPI003438E89E
MASPVKDVSVAGLRAGLNPQTRSGLWLHVARAVEALRPCLVVIENVRGLLTPPLPFLWLRNGATGLRVRHDFPPLLQLMIRGVVSPGPEASTDR